MADASHIGLRIPRHHADLLRAVAERNGRTLSAEIRLAVAEHLHAAAEHPQPPTAAGAGGGDG